MAVARRRNAFSITRTGNDVEPPIRCAPSRVSQGTLDVRWRPPSLTALATDDRCHLDGMVVPTRRRMRPSPVNGTFFLAFAATSFHTVKQPLIALPRLGISRRTVARSLTIDSRF